MKPIASVIIFYLLFALQTLVIWGNIYSFSDRSVFKKNAKPFFILSAICSSIMLIMFILLLPHRKMFFKKKSSVFSKGIPLLFVLMLASSIWLTSLHYRNMKSSVNYFDSSNKEGTVCSIIVFVLFIIPLAPILPHFFIIR